MVYRHIRHIMVSCWHTIYASDPQAHANAFIDIQYSVIRNVAIRNCSACSDVKS